MTSSNNSEHKLKKQLGKSMKTLRLDREGEYLDIEFHDYLIEHDILSQLTTLRTPHQNGVVEGEIERCLTW